MLITANNIMLITALLLAFSVWAGKAGGRFGIPALRNGRRAECCCFS